MKDADCAAFLQWALPQIGLRWKGFRKVRGQVCKRVARSVRELGLPDVLAYRRHLESHAQEWQVLVALCTIPISRFYRDKDVFDSLGCAVLPVLAKDALARGSARLECWSAGCASGEEPYTLAIQWRMLLAPRFPELDPGILGTDVDASLLERAGLGCYNASSLESLPGAWRDQAFERRDKLFCLREAWRCGVQFERQELPGCVWVERS
jgi:chemotaxis protein methyltransferase CheR